MGRGDLSASPRGVYLWGGWKLGPIANSSGAEEVRHEGDCSSLSCWGNGGFQRTDGSTPTPQPPKDGSGRLEYELNGFLGLTPREAAPG